MKFLVFVLVLALAASAYAFSIEFIGNARINVFLLIARVINKNK